MSLITTIRSHQLTARKAKDSVTASLLTTLIGEAEMIGKNAGNRETTDMEVTEIIEKFVKNARMTLGLVEKQITEQSVQSAIELRKELRILEAYLPKQFTNDQLLQIINDQITNGVFTKDLKSKGAIMAFLKSNYAGQYDGKVAALTVDAALKA